MVIIFIVCLLSQRTLLTYSTLVYGLRNNKSARTGIHVVTIYSLRPIKQRVSLHLTFPSAFGGQRSSSLTETISSNSEKPLVTFVAVDLSLVFGYCVAVSEDGGTIINLLIE